MNPVSEAYNIDCMEYMYDISDKFFDLAIVDLPYGINATEMNMGTNLMRTSGGYPSESTASKLRRVRLISGRDRWDLCRPGQEYFAELFRVSRNQIIWGGNYFPLPPSRCIICWDKMQPWEDFSQIEVAWTSFDRPASLFRCSNTGGANKETKIHPTQKPIALYVWLLRKFGFSGAKILDTHLGSGSSRIAAYKLGMDFYGCEIDRNYFESQERRFKKSCLGIIQVGDKEIVQGTLF